MTSKSEIAIWTAAGELFFENQPMEAIEAFSQINSYSKVLFNVGMIYSFMGDYENADSMFEKSLWKDQFFAAAYFQKGLALFELHEYDLAIRCYRFSLKLLLENDCIDYTSLGLAFKLYRCEILYNLAISNLKFGDAQKSDMLLREAYSCRRTSKHHSSIDVSNMLETDENRIPFSIPPASLFLIPDQKVRNLEKKDYLKSAKLVVDTKQKEKNLLVDDFIGFAGAAIVKSDQIIPGSTLVRQKTNPTTPPSNTPFETAFPSDSLIRTVPRHKGYFGESDFKARHRRNASEPSIHRSLTSIPNVASPSSATIKGTLQSFFQNNNNSTEMLKMKLKKSSRYQSPPNTPTSTYIKKDNDSGYTEIFNKNMKMPTKSTSSCSGATLSRNIIKIIIHNKKANITFRVKRGIVFEQFAVEVKDALNLSELPNNLCFLDKNDTFISLVNQRDLDLNLANQKIAHLYIKDQFDSTSDLLDFYT